MRYYPQKVIADGTYTITVGSGGNGGSGIVILRYPNTYTISQLRDALHKFVETREIITNITLIKLSTKELVCP